MHLAGRMHEQTHFSPSSMVYDSCTPRYLLQATARGKLPRLVAAGSAYSAVLVWQLPAASQSDSRSIRPERHLCPPLYLLEGHGGVIHR